MGLPWLLELFLLRPASREAIEAGLRQAGAQEVLLEVPHPEPRLIRAVVGQEDVANVIATLDEDLGVWGDVFPLALDLLTPPRLSERGMDLEEGQIYEIRFLAPSSSRDLVRQRLEQGGLLLEGPVVPLREHVRHARLPGSRTDTWARVRPRRFFHFSPSEHVLVDAAESP
jgi:hypothetical protein